MNNLIIKYFQEKGLEKIDSEEYLVCLVDDYTEITLITQDGFTYLISENIELSNFLNFKINITGWDDDKIISVLDLIF